ncbi:MAG: type II secretion system F family protein, partial [Brevundimonas sp.]
MNGFMHFITDPQNLLSIGVGVAVFASVLTLLNSFMGGERLDKRMKAVAERRDELKRRSRQAMKGGVGSTTTTL